MRVHGLLYLNISVQMYFYIVIRMPTFRMKPVHSLVHEAPGFEIFLLEQLYLAHLDWTAC